MVCSYFICNITRAALRISNSQSCPGRSFSLSSHASTPSLIRRRHMSRTTFSHCERDRGRLCEGAEVRTYPSRFDVRRLYDSKYGKSGPGARPLIQEWVTDVRDQCLRGSVPFFFKQWGGVQKKKAGRTPCPELVEGSKVAHGMRCQ